ncbi:ATP-binding protein [Stenotrophomonas acidaminiphila]|uniref:ATP-binding protein n=1 Tax=Stenotrophomonas acidaminiphila TaxID=128780 RepID=UPI002357770F|nr:ATP-binding protein [Stenotrophomonas acidaminiphila]
MSLRLRLLLAIGLSVAVLWTGAALWMLRDLDRSLQRTLDDRLAMSARMVAGLVAQSGTGIGSPISAQGALMVPGSHGMACQIRSLRGEIVATTRSAAGAPIAVRAPGYRTAVVDGHAWRTYTLRTAAFDITTADRLDERGLLRRRIALAAGVPFLLAALGGLAALWFGAGRALAPLAGLRRTLASRPPDATEPIDGGRLPSELRPLIDALNGLLDRMGQALQRERSFTNDAAHELRTPLTIVDTHLQVARMTAAEATQQPLADAASGVARLRGTLEQLLMLARVEGRVSFDDGTRITAVEAVDRAIAAVGDGAQRVKVTAPPDPVLLALPPQLAVVALRNLVENALRYSPAGTTVDIAIESAAGQIRFVVTDHGAGMDVEELRSATRRFWRARTDTPGTGLGLTLVDAIASRFGGSLELTSATPQGLSATLVLPRRP